MQAKHSAARILGKPLLPEEAPNHGEMSTGKGAM